MAKKLNDFKGNIYISGFMASGKSTLGAYLAEKLQMKFMDLDRVIEKNENKSIKEIFENEGEKYFRKIEQEYLLELSKSFQGVIALGGGALQNQKVIDHLKSHGILIFLDTPLQESVERIYHSNERPILFTKDGKIKTKQALFEELKTLYSQRLNLYKQAQVSIKTHLFSTTEAIAEVAIKKLNQHV